MAEDVGLSPAEMVRRAWDLSDLARRYELVLARYARRQPAPGDELLLTHLELLSLLQRFIRLDPRLPAELLPDGAGQAGVRLLRDRRAEWSGPARERWRQIVREAGHGHDPAGHGHDPAGHGHDPAGHGHDPAGHGHGSCRPRPGRCRPRSRLYGLTINQDELFAQSPDGGLG